MYRDIKDVETIQERIISQEQRNMEYYLSTPEGREYYSQRTGIPADKITPEIIIQNEKAGLQKVAEEHSKLPVQNELQKTIQELTIALANKDWETASRNINIIKKWHDK